MWALRACTLVIAAGALLAQHDPTPTEIETGGFLYRANCSTCHGPDGNSVGGVDLSHGKFKRASSYNDIIQIVKTGIPGTGMPSIKISETSAEYIVAYLRSLSVIPASPTAGDAARGKVIFEGKGACLTCHRVKGNGSRLGPELSDVGAERRVSELERSVLEPDAEVLPQNRFVRVVTRDGATVTGRLLSQDTFRVQLMDPQERLRSFSRPDLRELTILKNSQMPSYQGKLSSQELADLVSYMVSLKGVDKP